PTPPPSGSLAASPATAAPPERAAAPAAAPSAAPIGGLDDKASRLADFFNGEVISDGLVDDDPAS
ncbi:MAG: hypothetical protein ACKOPN_00150, partial [Prochlorococcaceae cyanobacterium]